MAVNAREMLRHVGPYWPLYCVGSLAVVGTNGAQLLSTFALRDAVNLIAGQESGGSALATVSGEAAEGVSGLFARAAQATGWRPLLVLAVAFTLLIVAQGGFRFLWRWGFVKTSQRIARDLRARLFSHLLTLDHGYFDKNRTGALLSVATSDVEAVRLFLGIGILLIVDTILYFLMVPPVMFRIDTRLALLLMAPLPFIPLLTNRLGQRVHRRFMLCQEQLAEIAARAQEGMAGMKVVKSFVQQENEVRDFDALATRSVNLYVSLARAQALFTPVLTFVVSAEVFLLMLFGGDALAGGRVTAGDFLQLFMLTQMLTGPMTGLGWTMSLYQRGLASYERFREVVDQRAAIADPPESPSAGVAPARVEGEIEFRNLTFTYPGAATPALRGVNLTAPRGKTVALVGEVGAGKTALASLVARFYEAPEGQVLVDGHDVRRYSLRTLRRAIGFVPQNTFLFSQSIEENIALGLASFTREQAAAAARVAGLEEDIAGFQHGYATLLGERGVNLSGGQRQRLALARAVILAPRILILDDCLSSVDTRTEEQILSGLRQVLSDRTCLFIAHRMSTVRHADFICVLEEGRIVERGTHEELMALGGWYAQTYRHQMLEREMESDGG
ncbi:MAG: ABC transporter ATP-binding protein [Planctomycetes bacterium]|nr:ABC transporter ATP-binding protein [Planctomycetota bacterium]